MAVHKNPILAFLFLGWTTSSLAINNRVVWAGPAAGGDFGVITNWSAIDGVGGNQLPGYINDTGATNAIIQGGGPANVNAPFTPDHRFDILIIRNNRTLNIADDLNFSTSNVTGAITPIPIWVGQTGNNNTINHTAGIVTSGNLRIGDAAADGGVYNLSGTGTISATSLETRVSGTLNIGIGGATFGTITTPSITNRGQIVFNATADHTFSTIINGSGTVTKNNVDTVTLSGTNTYSGNTTVNDSGTLLITGTHTADNSSYTVNDTSTLQVGDNGSGSIASDSVTVNTGATLAGSGTVGDDPTDTVTITSGAFLEPGDSEGNDVDTLDITGILDLQAGSLTTFDINTSTTIDAATAALDANVFATVNALAGTAYPQADTDNEYDQIVANTVNLTAGGTILVSPLSFAPVKGMVYQLFNSANINQGSFAVGNRYRSGSQNAGYDLKLPDLTAASSSGTLRWDTSLFISDGILVIVPEPSRALLLALGLFGFLLHRRR